MSPNPTSLPLRIFIVENHEDTLECLMMHLQGQGHTVSVATTVAEALEKIPSFHCDVLLTDIGLPDGTGWDLMRRLGPLPYAIAMSGFGMTSDHVQSREAGFKKHLLKPFTPSELDLILTIAANEVAHPPV